MVYMRKIVPLEHTELYLQEELIYLYHQFYHYLQMILGWVKKPEEDGNSGVKLVDMPWTTGQGSDSLYYFNYK